MGGGGERECGKGSEMKYLLLTDISWPDTSTPPRSVRWRARFIAAREFPGNGKWKISRGLCFAITPPRKPRADCRFQRRRDFVRLASRIIEACQTALSLMQHYRIADADEIEDTPKRGPICKKGDFRKSCCYYERRGTFQGAFLTSPF